MLIARGTSKGQLVALPFGQANVAASQTDVQLVASDPSANDGYAMPFDGEVVAVSWNLSAASTAGSLTVGATVEGTEDADTTLTVPADSATVRGYKRVPRNKATFVAGQRIGAEITTNAGFLPITTDLTVVVWAIVQIDGI
jgi:hypothetical protein